jgi:hypothetical protein
MLMRGTGKAAAVGFAGKPWTTAGSQRHSVAALKHMRMANVTRVVCNFMVILSLGLGFIFGIESKVA